MHSRAWMVLGMMMGVVAEGKSGDVERLERSGAGWCGSVVPVQSTAYSTGAKALKFSGIGTGCRTTAKIRADLFRFVEICWSIWGIYQLGP